ncbi:MAG: hypothetical protein A2X12_08215 [Bacteroidetes bacterium GWE2_29_8]|nr:MAG: hypothetical protein A2X12_08215 [Bacteroidetes bacterium GWE2_29_8]
MDKFQNKYRIPSNRKPNWDYSANGIYFLTIVTQNRECNLGKIVETHENVETHGRASLQLYDFGNIVESEWYKSFEIRNELFLDEFIIMPNHIHAIVVLDNQSPFMESQPNILNSTIKRNPAIRLPKSISSFIACFKSAVNKKIDNYIDENKITMPKYNRNNHFFQPNYHDHIIRNDWEYQRIKNYIVNNLQNWNTDKFNNNNA